MGHGESGGFVRPAEDPESSQLMCSNGFWILDTYVLLSYLPGIQRIRDQGSKQSGGLQRILSRELLLLVVVV